MDTAELVTALRELLGTKLVAYLGKVKETRAVRQWAEGARKIADPTDVERPRGWLTSPLEWSTSGMTGRSLRPGFRGSIGFHGRWDDPAGLWRILYLGSSAFACYREVLAPFRPDPELQTDVDEIVGNDDGPFPHHGAGPVSLHMV